MSTVDSPPRIIDEIADLIASRPAPEALLAFRPSPAVQQRAKELLALQRERSLSSDEQRELEQFTQAELLMRLVKARVRLGQS